MCGNPFGRQAETKKLCECYTFRVNKCFCVCTIDGGMRLVSHHNAQCLRTYNTHRIPISFMHKWLEFQIFKCHYREIQSKKLDCNRSVFFAIKTNKFSYWNLLLLFGDNIPYEQIKYGCMNRTSMNMSACVRVCVYTREDIRAASILKISYGIQMAAELFVLLDCFPFSFRNNNTIRIQLCLVSILSL